MLSFCAQVYSNIIYPNSVVTFVTSGRAEYGGLFDCTASHVLQEFLVVDIV